MMVQKMVWQILQQMELQRLVRRQITAIGEKADCIAFGSAAFTGVVEGYSDEAAYGLATGAAEIRPCAST
jgi:hypothetical protein